MDLSRLIEHRVHLTGFDCAALRALRTIRAVFHPLNVGGTNIEFWEHSTTNPAKVACIDCWREHTDVQRAFGPWRIVIDIRRT